jgi:hypothetical protein
MHQPPSAQQLSAITRRRGWFGEIRMEMLLKMWNESEDAEEQLWVILLSSRDEL